MDVALQNTIMNENLEEIKRLVESDVDIHLDNDVYLRYASSFCSVDVVNELIRAGADVNAKNGEIVLCAIIKDKLENIKALIAAKYDIHVQNNLPLLTAVKHNKHLIVSYLIEAGVDISAENYKALCIAVRYGLDNCATILLQAGADIRAFYTGRLQQNVLENKTDIVQQYISLGADIDEDNSWALLTACMENFIEIVKILIMYTDTNYDGALTLAIDMKNSDIAIMLINIYRCNYEKALSLAMTYRNTKVFCALIDLNLKYISNSTIDNYNDTRILEYIIISANFDTSIIDFHAILDLGDVKNAALARIRQLELKKFSKVPADSICCICLENIEGEHNRCCGKHMFHVHCLNTWLEKIYACPIVQNEKIYIYSRRTNSTMTFFYANKLISMLS
jgi:hypothetical protein